MMYEPQVISGKKNVREPGMFFLTNRAYQPVAPIANMNHNFNPSMYK